jgi:monoamine oxidase
MAGARRMFAAHRQAEREGNPVEEVLGRERELRAAFAGGREERGQTRRELLIAGATVAGGAAIASSPTLSFAKSLARAREPRIAVVGGGLAGLRCAHQLWTKRSRNPIAATVYDANPTRAGGRCWTLRDFFADGLSTEHGGSFLNSNQLSVRRLAALLGLEEEIVNGGDLPSGDEVYWIDGAYYTEAEASADWTSVGYPVFHSALNQARKSAAQERRLDAMSVSEWLDSTEIGSGSRFGKLMTANTVTENGGDPDVQSALDLIELTAGKKRSALVPLPGDDERFHIVGGNDQLVSRMIEQLPPGALQQGHELIALRAGSGSTSTLVFDVAGSTVEVTADAVVLALPFSTLRDVDLSKSGLSATKQHVIQTFGMGSNAKIHVELSHKSWPALGFSGATYSEFDRFCCAWDDTVQLGPQASPALFLGFPGGTVGRSGLTGEAHGSAPVADVDWLLGQIELVFPGTTGAHTGLAYEDHWALDPWVKGAYSFYAVGQAASFGELAGAREGSIYFAGEHTSIENQGFLDGAVETGERAAREVLARAF